MHAHGTVPAPTHSHACLRRSLWKRPALVTSALLLIPALGTTWGHGWNWSFRAYVLVGSIFFCVGFAYQLVTRNADKSAYRAAMGMSLLAGTLLVWLNFIQAADDINPDAVMYFCVPLVGMIGAGLTRLRAQGMARALFATAISQALILAALLVRNPHVPSFASAVPRGFAINAILAGLFAGSALLFQRSASGNASPGAA